MGLIIYIKHFELACSNMQSCSSSNSWYFQKWAPHNLIFYVPDGKTAPTFVCRGTSCKSGVYLFIPGISRSMICMLWIINLGGGSRGSDLWSAGWMFCIIYRLNERTRWQLNARKYSDFRNEQPDFNGQQGATNLSAKRFGSAYIHLLYTVYNYLLNDWKYWMSRATDTSAIAFISAEGERAQND